MNTTQHQQQREAERVKQQQYQKERAAKAAKDKELRLKEEEDLQLALALSASEAESKQQMECQVGCVTLLMFSLFLSTQVGSVLLHSKWYHFEFNNNIIYEECSIKKLLID